MYGDMGCRCWYVIYDQKSNHFLRRENNRQLLVAYSSSGLDSVSNFFFYRKNCFKMLRVLNAFYPEPERSSMHFVPVYVLGKNILL